MPPSSSASHGRADARLRTAGTAIGAVVFAAIVLYLWRSVRAGELALGRANLGMLATSMALLLAAYAAQALAWHLLVRAAGGASTLRADCARWALSLLGKYVPGKIFHAIGRVLLYREHLPGPAGASAAIVAELLLTLTAAACVAAVALAPHAGQLPFAALPIAAAGAVVGLALSLSTAFDRLAGRVAARAMKSSPPVLIAPRLRLVPFALQAASYVLLGAGLHLLARAWDMSDVVPLAVAMGALCLSGIVGVVAFIVPAGIGVREGALVWLLAPFGGVSQAAFIAVAARVWLTAGDVVAAAIGGLVLRRGPAAVASRPFTGDVRSFGFGDDPAGRARRGRRIVALLSRFHRADLSAMSVLDVGCSAGLITAEVSRHVASAVGIDPEFAAVRRAQSAAAVRGNLVFVCGRGEALPFADGSFDIVVCNHVYEHAADPWAMMREIARVLRADGACFFAGGHTLQLIEPHYRLPLLSLMPRPLASAIVRATGSGGGYEIRFLPPWRLRELFAGFGRIRPLTAEVLREPARYGLSDGVMRHRAVRAVARVLAPLGAIAAPTQLWLLTRPHPPRPGRAPSGSD